MEQMDNKTKKVMVFGVFDIFHKGHEFFLNEARKYGNYLIIVTPPDENIIEEKGRAPINSQEKRLRFLKKYADKVILGDKEDYIKPLLKEMPDVICLGYDQKSYKSIIDSFSKIKKVEVVRIKSFMPEKYKSSIIREDTKKQKDNKKERK